MEILWAHLPALFTHGYILEKSLTSALIFNNYLLNKRRINKLINEPIVENIL